MPWRMFHYLKHHNILSLPHHLHFLVCLPIEHTNAGLLEVFVLLFWAQPLPCRIQPGNKKRVNFPFLYKNYLSLNVCLSQGFLGRGYMQYQRRLATQDKHTHHETMPLEIMNDEKNMKHNKGNKEKNKW